MGYFFIRPSFIDFILKRYLIKIKIYFRFTISKVEDRKLSDTNQTTLIFLVTVGL